MTDGITDGPPRRRGIGQIAAADQQNFFAWGLAERRRRLVGPVDRRHPRLATREQVNDGAAQHAVGAGDDDPLALHLPLCLTALSACVFGSPLTRA